MTSLTANLNDNAWHNTALTIEEGGSLLFEVDGYAISKPLYKSFFNFEGRSFINRPTHVKNQSELVIWSHDWLSANQGPVFPDSVGSNPPPLLQVACLWVASPPLTPVTQTISPQ